MWKVIFFGEKQNDTFAWGCKYGTWWLQQEADQAQIPCSL
jgi:hypothetical protein